MGAKSGKKGGRSGFFRGSEEITVVRPDLPVGKRNRPVPQSQSDGQLVGLAIVCLSITLLGTAAALFSMLPDISVSQPQPLNEANPFSVPFVISNDGPLTVNSLTFACVAMDIQVVQQTQAFTSGIRSETISLDKLAPKEKVSLPCTFRQVPRSWEISSLHPMIMGKIDIFLEYRPAFVFWNETQQYRFATFSDPNRKLHWEASPLPERWTHLDGD